MNTEQYLKSLKKDYLETELSEKFALEGWQDLQEKIKRLERPNLPLVYKYLRPVAFAFLALFILAGSFAGLVQASQKSLPDEPLYPIKRFSEDLITVTTGNNLIKVDNRAEEIVDLSKKEDSKNLKQAVKEYKEEVSEATKSGKNTRDFREKLEEHEEKFEGIKNTSHDGQLQEAIQAAHDGSHGGDKENENKTEHSQEEENHSGSNSGKD